MYCGKYLKRRAAWAVAALIGCSAAHAEGWCDLAPGWSVVTHGTKSENVFLLAAFQGVPNALWIQISDGINGKPNVALALTAHALGQSLSLYVDSPSYTCATFPSWAPIGQIRHVRIIG